MKVTVPAASRGTSKVSLDYSGFANAYGGDYGSRLRLVEMPACALTTPAKAECRTQKPVTADNDVSQQSLTLSVPAASKTTTMVLAADAAATSGAGTYTATTLSPSSTWAAGGSSGDFSWSYPLSVPTPAAGVAPQLSIDYDSQSVDGRGPSTNNQPSWIGEGFDLQTPYIERSYDVCDDDGQSGKYDQCWANDNATLVMDGKTTPLIKDSTTGVWHPKDDDDERVVRSTGASNGDNDGEYWTVTTVDGTQYVFGKNRLPGWSTGDPETNAALTVPVYGNDSGEPGYSNGSTFADRAVTQAYQWNLDYVIDTHGNAMSYWYTKETNAYAQDGTTTAAGTAYDRASYLDHIDYGITGDDFFGKAPDEVKFTTAERCSVTSTENCSSLTSSTAKDWPDVPFDQICATGKVCTGTAAPTFFSRKRLTGVTTYVWDTSLSTPAYRKVDSWALDQSFVDPGDGTSASLWLKSITRTGQDGTPVSLPPVTFTGEQLANRVDTSHDDIAALIKWRVRTITTETGSVITVNYNNNNPTGQCVAGTTMPSTPDNDTLLCYPVIWTPPTMADPQTDYFNKYVVDQVVQSDPTGGSPDEETDYTYADPAWHYATDDVASAAKDKTWSQWRGFGLVTTTTGNSQTTRTKTVTTYFQGMDGDKQSDGTKRSVTVVDSNGDHVTDADPLAGQARESRTFNGTAEVSSTITDEWTHATGTDGTRTSYYVHPGATHTRTDRASGSPRIHTVTTTYDDNTGAATQVDDGGDAAVTGDEQCTRTTYSDNTTAWLRAEPIRVETVDVGCDAAVSRPADVVSDTRTLYDNTAYGTAPSRGDVTSTQRLSSYSGTSPVYQTVATTAYDSMGRTLSVKDADGNTTSTAYTPTTGGPLTGTVATDAKGYQTTTTYDPARNLQTTVVDPNNHRTDYAYDALGRLTSVWLPDRAKDTAQPNTTYEYVLSNSASSYVRTGSIQKNGTSYLYSYTLYDAMLRQRQTQAPAANGGRVITETKYDSRGLAVEADSNYVDATDPSGTLANITSAQPSQTLTTYDGDSRPTVAAFYADGAYKWSTTTTYGGDRTTVVPPQGGIATTTLTDVFGRTSEVRQYNDGTSSGAYTSITYAYNDDDQLTKVTDDAGNIWTYGYDLMGRQTSMSDPDAGTSISTYTDLDKLASTTDSRGKTISYTYDQLGRKTGEYDATVAQQAPANQIAGWTYDTLAKGQPTASIRYVGGSGTTGKAYSTAVTTYDSLYRATRTTVTVPSVTGEEALAGSYLFTSSYNADGTLYATSDPAAGGMKAEAFIYGYNAADLPTTLQNYVQGTTYTGTGQIAQITLGINATAPYVQENNTYQDGTDRLSEQLVNDADSGLVQQSHYAYDPSGNPTLADTRADGADDTQCYQYDGHDRLTAAYTSSDTWQTTGACSSDPTTATLGSGPAPYWQSYTYDDLGNRTKLVQHATTTGAQDTTTTYTYGNTDGTQPHTLTGSSTTGATSASTSTTTDTYSYDAAGSTTTRDLNGTTQKLAYDDEDNLASVTNADGTSSSYLYDADGNRLLTRDDTGTTLYLGDTEVHLDKGTTSTSATRYYTWLGQTIAVRDGAGTLQWLLDDAHNTATTQIDSATQAVQRRRTDPFGNDRGTSPTSWAGDQGFVGGVADDSTGLTHLGARDYDPTTGRFTTLDPVLELTDPQQINGYAYAADNPVLNADPDGLMIYGDGAGDGPAPTQKKSTGSGKKKSTTSTKQSVQTWINDWSPSSNNTHDLLADFMGGSQGNSSSDAPYWQPQHGGNDGLFNVCYGRTACSRAYTYLLHHQDDPAGAKEVAATYCVVNYSECAHDARAQTLVEKESAAFVQALAMGVGDIDLSGKVDGGGGGCSFAPTTRVLLEDGTTKPISKIKPGDKVEAADPSDGKKKGDRKVTATWINHDNDLVDLTVQTSDGHTATLHTTASHPFWDDTTHQWTPVGALALGDALNTAANRHVHVTALHTRPGTADMYNLTVDELHTYYVLAGDTPVLVHNSGGACKEVTLPRFDSFEQARNMALDLLGEVDPATRQPYIGRLESAPTTYGKVVGFTTRVNGEFKRFRMDYDPVKGPHINVEVGKGDSARKWAVPWNGTEDDFARMLGGNS
ncbi:polymorphic toxin-type HINT domain-containing protein [Streptomyces sp. CA2R106]|uniref:polymorphic toxin-type HINT domain-containing protein n=1 Tax=Streptomyces sp. CA2R106 TaxID=3120153 RepID=UPI00300B6CC4